MARLFALALAGVAATLVVAGTAGASPDRGTAIQATALSFAVDPLQEEVQIDALSTSADPGTRHIGPIASSSPDSSTCGNDWAEDHFDRFFTIRQTGPATYTVYEQFKNGTFVTFTALSPGACDSSDGYGPGVVTAGIDGTMHGYLIANVFCVDPLTPCLDAGAACGGNPDPCQTTAGFLKEFFPGQPYTIDTFFFHYAGYDGSNSALVVNEWKNASCNRGGNHGDIATATTTAVEFDVC